MPKKNQAVKPENLYWLKLLLMLLILFDGFGVHGTDAGKLGSSEA